MRDQFDLDTGQSSLNRRCHMIGSPDSHPFGYSARWPVVAGQRGAMRALASRQPGTTQGMRRKILLLAARLRRILNGRAAAAMAHREQQAASFAQQQLNRRPLDLTRIYRGPIDQVLAKVAKLRKRVA